MTEVQANRQQDIEKITRLTPRVVTQEHNEMLTKLIGLQEVEEAMKQMSLGKRQAQMASQQTSFTISGI